MSSAKLRYPDLSICVPVYNVGFYIERCLISIMKQTYTGKMECIIVDDCGTDKSIAIAEQLIADYNGPIAFHIVHHEHNRGLAAARNTAVDAAKGEFIIHVDSDDWIDPNIVEELVKKQMERGADIVSCDAIAHYADREEQLTEPNYTSKDEMMHNILLLTLDHVIWRRLIRASLYRDNCISAVEGVNIGEDHYTLPRLLFYANSFAKCDKALYHYNCMNVNSYIQSTEQAFSPKRISSDVASLNILIDFFGHNEPVYLDELYKTKVLYMYDKFFVMLKLGHKDLYKSLSSDWQTIPTCYKKANGICALRSKCLSPSMYFINRCRVLTRIAIRKIFKARCYNL